MFIVFLRFSENKSQASLHMEGHKQWIKSGFEDEVFLLAGSIKPQMGGTVLAHNISHDKLLKRVNADPFVAENIVTAEIIEIDPSMAESRLAFLVEA